MLESGSKTPGRFTRQLFEKASLTASAALLVGALTIRAFAIRPYLNIVFWLFACVSLVLIVASFPRYKSLIALAISALSVWLSGHIALSSFHSEISSPDHRHKLVIYSMPMLYSSIGGGSDAPGYVQLQTKSGHILEEGYLEMVQLVQPEWLPGKVVCGRRPEREYIWNLR